MARDAGGAGSAAPSIEGTAGGSGGSSFDTAEMVAAGISDTDEERRRTAIGRSLFVGVGGDDGDLCLDLDVSRAAPLTELGLASAEFSGDEVDTPFE